jgi:hypothetical protein
MSKWAMVIKGSLGSRCREREVLLTVKKRKRERDHERGEGAKALGDHYHASGMLCLHALARTHLSRSCVLSGSGVGLEHKKTCTHEVDLAWP